MNKKLAITIGMAALAAGAFAGPHHGFHGGPRPGPHHGFHGPRPGFHHHGSYWGRGGRNFWPGFVGGVVGSALYNAVATPSVAVASPVVVTQPTVVATPTVVAPPAVVAQPAVVAAPTVVSTPVVTAPRVWVEGRYIDQIQPNGTVIRVWQPGHYE